jgi:hypothetical protein
MVGFNEEKFDLDMDECLMNYNTQQTISIKWWFSGCKVTILKVNQLLREMETRRSNVSCQMGDWYHN